ncbi:MAG TPA: hypothetical protein VM582_04660, partial [Candidatus Thermoplasmatota archaeon]|nr:hypothetical protein [Candidatus Thermoplasmatota archaeon]
LLEFDIDLSSVTRDQIVTADWWEYADRFNARAYYSERGAPGVTYTAPGVLTAHTFHPSTPAGNTYRFNLGEPKIIEARGKWLHMQADLTPLVPKLDALGTRTLTVGFAYTPVKQYTGSFSACSSEACTLSGTLEAAEANAELIFPEYRDDRGFAIDGFTVNATRVTGGAASAPVTLMTEEDAWNARRIFECGIGWSDLGERVPQQAPGWWGNPAFIGCLDNNGPMIRRTPVARDEGRNWNLVTEMPGVNASWRVVKVRDALGFDEQRKLPTGDIPYAWYTGDLTCRDLAPNTDRTCPRPSSEARLVTPVFDLSRIAGDNAQLSFWHRFAFNQRNISSTPLAAGGVVEISIQDAQTGEWSDWQQIYSSKDFRVGNPQKHVRDGTRGGYTGFTANFSSTADGQRRFDPPFENVRAPDRKDPVQFLYTGNSKDIEREFGVEGAALDGWLREEFDVSEHIGRKVRFGFHYAYSTAPILAQRSTQLNSPDAAEEERDQNKVNDLHGRTGWWVANVAVVGDVLVGKPVQLRFRAGTDANVHDGHFLVDDIGVFGARYRNNVGIFVDQTPDAFGAYPGTTTTIPVTIRNLGDSVRRDLALEIRGPSGSLVTLSGQGPEGNATVDGALVLKGFTLGPGQSAVAEVKVTTPKNLSAKNETLVLQLREANPLSTTKPFGAITNNEVQGLLVRYLDFRLQSQGELEIVRSAVEQVQPAVGDAIDHVVTARNPGHGPITLEAECVARTISGHAQVDHASTGVETPVVDETYPCEISGSLELGAKQWTNLTFRATPTKAGFLAFSVKLRVVGVENRTLPMVGVPVGVPLVAYRETFDAPESLRAFTGSMTGVSWSHTRGNAAPGSLLLGINETLAGTQEYASSCSDGFCVARTPPIDLHNYSPSTKAYLSFWHLDRMARFDGAQVRIQVLENELRPTSDGAWSDECILRPLNGYEGKVEQVPAQAGTSGGVQQDGSPGDPNPAFGNYNYSMLNTSTAPDFFITPSGVWEESWALAVMPIPATCKSPLVSGKEVPVLGRTVRFNFYMFPGAST